MTTLVTPDNAYGGPVRVAVNQLKALGDMGHQVRLFAARRGYEVAPCEMGGVPLTTYPARRLVPKSKFAGLSSLPLLAHMREGLSTFDVIHVHLARDLVTLPAASLAMHIGIPLFAQTHGMIDQSDHALARSLDAVFTKTILRGASTVFYLTDNERAALERVAGPGLNLASLLNGVPRPVSSPPAAGQPEVLFLSRLHPRKRADNFVRASVRLASEFPDVRFRLVGPDEGQGELVSQLIRQASLGDRLRWEGAVSPDATLDRMRQATVFVLPSVDEPFGMSAIEAASLGKPIIVTESCGLAPSIREYDAGFIIRDTIDDLVAAVRGLLADPHLAQKKGAASKRMVNDRYRIETVASTLLEAYQSKSGGGAQQ